VTDSYNFNNRDFFIEFGSLKTKLEMVEDKLNSIEEKIDNISKELACMRGNLSKVEGRASVWGVITAIITTALINLGLKK